MTTRRRGGELLAELFEDEEGRAWLQLRGQCMDPLLIDGDRIKLSTPPGRLRIGQMVVALTGDGELICHRFIGRDREGRLLLAGDRGGRVDVLEEAAAVGRAVARQRNGRLSPLDGGWLLRWLDSAIAVLRRWSWRLAPLSPRLLRAPRRPLEWTLRLLLLVRGRSLT